MFGHRDHDDSWEDLHKHNWDWEDRDREHRVLTMDVVGIICVVGGAVLLCSLLACCCKRRRGGVVLSPPPPPPPGPNNPMSSHGPVPMAAPYPQQQYVPYPAPVTMQAAAYPAPYYPVTPHMGVTGGVHDTAPSAPEIHALPPSYEQAVGAMTSPYNANTSSPYNPHYKQ